MKKRIALSSLILVCIITTTLVGCNGETESATKGKVQQKVLEQSLADAIKVHGWEGLNTLANQGDSRAQFFIGVAYLTGDGIPKNHIEARKWIRKAANQGVANAQFLMGMLTQADIKTARLSEVISLFANAYMWFNLAAAQGHEEAKENLANLESKPTAETVQAIKKGQILASNWRPCLTASCWDYEPPVDRIKLNAER
ncbi:tetratricopeptide repeat protein [Undibacterium sp. 5I1]|uniref:tetratricopeptide repeat protein n=1 Tax=unclassified Undibacterium TaxID=2630295 RepID=UPI002AB36F2A|nr:MULTISPECIES: tetratricopeptide repeat protein [unclassified Undibacterium]MDY7538757.1 tetratricopeptide repeat protein [Undibacterium sp. 5I1]MEB0229696.1 tetratricopeptide repeat protein [Undibacterium sp. 10I3]MEB0258439.1 tetratricopeptide repeat protein [Undibacterium sp. 5I1]